MCYISVRRSELRVCCWYYLHVRWTVHGYLLDVDKYLSLRAIYIYIYNYCLLRVTTKYLYNRMTYPGCVARRHPSNAVSRLRSPTITNVVMISPRIEITPSRSSHQDGTTPEAETATIVATKASDNSPVAVVCSAKTSTLKQIDWLFTLFKYLFISRRTSANFLALSVNNINTEQ